MSYTSYYTLSSTSVTCGYSPVYYSYEMPDIFRNWRPAGMGQVTLFHTGGQITIGRESLLSYIREAKSAGRNYNIEQDALDKMIW